MGILLGVGSYWDAIIRAITLEAMSWAGWGGRGALGLREEHRSVWEKFGQSDPLRLTGFTDLPLIVGNKK